MQMAVEIKVSIILIQIIVTITHIPRASYNKAFKCVLSEFLFSASFVGAKEATFQQDYCQDLKRLSFRISIADSFMFPQGQEIRK